MAEGDSSIRVLITDVIMPGMNGKDLAEKISSILPEIKSIYMSGYTADIIAHHGVLDEGVNFIQKPFNINELAVSIKKAIT
jgi:YesN/AraC family two-component response regulator